VNEPIVAFPPTMLAVPTRGLGNLVRLYLALSLGHNKSMDVSCLVFLFVCLFLTSSLFICFISTRPYTEYL
jgi:hypothetical protein